MFPLHGVSGTRTMLQGGEDSLVRIVSMLMTLVQGIDEDGRATITITSRG